MLEIRALEEWTPQQRLEVAALILNPKATQMSAEEREWVKEIPPEFIADHFETAYSSASAVWLKGKCVLSCSIGVFPLPAFHFSHDGSLKRAEVVDVLTQFLDSQGRRVSAFTDRLAIGKWGAQHLGFHIVADGIFNMGLGSRHYYLFARPSSKQASA